MIRMTAPGKRQLKWSLYTMVEAGKNVQALVVIDAGSWHSPIGPYHSAAYSAVTCVFQ